MLGNQDHEERRHRLVIRCAKLYWKLWTHKEYDRLPNAGDTSVRNREAMSDGGGSTLFPAPQCSKDQRVIELMATGDLQSDFFERAFRVAGG